MMTPEDLAAVILAEHDLPEKIDRQRRYVAALSIALRSQERDGDVKQASVDDWRAAVDRLQELIDGRAVSRE